VAVKEASMTAVRLHVEIGAAETVTVRYGDMQLPLSAEAAGLLGRALIAAATANRSAEPPDVGFDVADAHLPVTAWRIGISKTHFQPVLMLEVTGGLWMSFELNTATAKEVSDAIAATVSTGTRQPGQLLS